MDESFSRIGSLDGMAFVLVVEDRYLAHFANSREAAPAATSGG